MYDLKMIEKFYSSFDGKINLLKDKLNRPLTYTEKVLFGHIDSDSAINSARRGVSYEEFNPCLLYTSPSPRDRSLSRMPSSA